MGCRLCAYDLMRRYHASRSSKGLMDCPPNKCTCENGFAVNPGDPRCITDGGAACQGRSRSEKPCDPGHDYIDEKQAVPVITDTAGEKGGGGFQDVGFCRARECHCHEPFALPKYKVGMELPPAHHECGKHDPKGITWEGFGCGECFEGYHFAPPEDYYDRNFVLLGQRQIKCIKNICICDKQSNYDDPRNAVLRVTGILNPMWRPGWPVPRDFMTNKYWNATFWIGKKLVTDYVKTPKRVCDKDGNEGCECLHAGYYQEGQLCMPKQCYCDAGVAPEEVFFFFGQGGIFRCKVDVRAAQLFFLIVVPAGKHPDSIRGYCKTVAGPRQAAGAPVAQTYVCSSGFKSQN